MHYNFDIIASMNSCTCCHAYIYTLQKLDITSTLHVVTCHALVHNFIFPTKIPGWKERGGGQGRGMNSKMNSPFPAFIWPAFYNKDNKHNIEVDKRNRQYNDSRTTLEFSVKKYWRADKSLFYGTSLRPILSSVN